jgi:glycosyltransferase involved in cell wall biosynthesis
MSNEAQHTEGCSNAIMEYMACRLPVVCSSGGGNPELVVHGQTGYLVTGGDRGALVQRLRQLAADGELAGRMGEAGRARLEREYSVGRLVGDLDRVYREALS